MTIEQIEKQVNYEIGIGIYVIIRHGEVINAFEFDDADGNQYPYRIIGDKESHNLGELIDLQYFKEGDTINHIDKYIY